MVICAVIGLLLLAIIAWLAVSGLKIRELSMAPKVACARCGHFLDEGQLRCPECGTQWDNAWLARLQSGRGRSGPFRIALAAILLLLVLVGILAAVLPLLNYVNKAQPMVQPVDTKGLPSLKDAPQRTACASIRPIDQAQSHATHTHRGQWRVQGVDPLA